MFNSASTKIGQWVPVCQDKNWLWLPRIDDKQLYTHSSYMVHNSYHVSTLATEILSDGSGNYTQLITQWIQWISSETNQISVLSTQETNRVVQVERWDTLIATYQLWKCSWQRSPFIDLHCSQLYAQMSNNSMQLCTNTKTKSLLPTVTTVHPLSTPSEKN